MRCRSVDSIRAISAGLVTTYARCSDPGVRCGPSPLHINPSRRMSPRALRMCRRSRGVAHELCNLYQYLNAGGRLDKKRLAICGQNDRLDNIVAGNSASDGYAKCARWQRSAADRIACAAGDHRVHCNHHRFHCTLCDRAPLRTRGSEAVAHGRVGTAKSFRRDGARRARDRS